MKTFQETMYHRHLPNDENIACIIGHSFIRRLINRWQKLEIPLPDFSFDAFGTGGLKISALLDIVSSNNFSDYRVVFIQVGENDVMDGTLATNKRYLMQIYDELKRQGVDEVAFGALFPRHDRLYNKRKSLINRVVVKLHPEKMWLHGTELEALDSIRRSDGTHLLPRMESAFSGSIRNAVQTMMHR